MGLLGKKPRLEKDYSEHYNFLNLRMIMMLAAVSRSAASLLRAGAPKAQQAIPALQAISHRDYAAAAPGHKGQIVAVIGAVVDVQFEANQLLILELQLESQSEKKHLAALLMLLAIQLTRGVPLIPTRDRQFMQKLLNSLK